jgi:hypothetical protein
MSPFPGMDPYLEHPEIWPDFHDALVTVLRAELNSVLPPPYYARSQKRPEVGIALETPELRHINPDVVIARPPHYGSSTTPTAVIERPRTQATAGLKVRINTEPFQHRFVEIRDAAHQHRLVTLIEIVSPSNKHSGPDRQAYEAKQHDVLASNVNLIEIDLLRRGRRLLPYPELIAAVNTLAADYLVLLNRSEERVGGWMDYTLFPISLHDPLPCIPVPLEDELPDVLLDLQVAFNRVYEEGPYRRILDYMAQPDPPLKGADIAWAAELLQNHLTKRSE